MNYFEYELTTPLKAIASISANINKNILISADYELIDYSTSELNVDNLRNDDGSEIFAIENNTIKDTYQKSENIRLGAEYKMNPFSLRVGHLFYKTQLLM